MKPAQLRCRHASADDSNSFGHVSIRQQSEILRFEVDVCDVCFAEILVLLDGQTEASILFQLRRRLEAANDEKRLV